MYQGWYPPPPMPMQPPHGQPPHPGPHMGPHPPMPMYLRTPPSALQGPGTPISHTHALPPVHPSHPSPALSHAPNSIGGLKSPPPTSSSASIPRPNAGLRAFVPRAKVTLKKKEHGTELNLENFAAKSIPAPVPSATATPSPQGSVASAVRAASDLEPFAPLQATANRWDRKALVVDAESPEMVDHKVKGLLNKLTLENFDSISDQIIAWMNKSEKENDGRTMIQIIRLVFEHLTDEATLPEMYARLCRKMMEQISPKVQDDSIKNNEGKPVAGGRLFLKYLLNRCQEDFERDWVTKKTTAAYDQAVKATNDKAKEDGKDDEAALDLDKYYAAQKARRQYLGLIKFIGELFKLQMLTERVMHECVKKLLGNVDNPEEEEIESLCKLLTIVGGILDHPKARAHLDVYFSCMKELTKSPNVNSRMQYMLLDLIELRERRWVSRTSVAAPTTIAQIHEAWYPPMSLQSPLGYTQDGADPNESQAHAGSAVSDAIGMPTEDGNESDIAIIKHHIRSLVRRMKEEQDAGGETQELTPNRINSISVMDEEEKKVIAIINLLVNADEIS